MNERKALTFLGIVIAIDAALWNLIVPQWWFILIDIVIIALCILIDKFEFWIVNSHHKWIDWFYYIFSRNIKEYKTLQKTIDYSIKSLNEAEFESNSVIKVCKASNNFYYLAQYQWEQEKEIGFKLHDENKYSYQRTDECNWTSVEIKPNNLVHKHQELEIGFSLTNLEIKNLVRHSFLSHRVTDKIKHLKMVAHIDSGLKPLTADFIVKNIYGFIIKRESLKYDETQQAFIKTIYCPRKGRQYIIQWGYNKP